LQWTGVGTAVAAVGVSMYGVASLLYWWLDRWAVPKVYYFCDSLHVRNSLCPPLVPGEVSSPPLLWERPQYVLYSVASLLYWSLVTGHWTGDEQSSMRKHSSTTWSLSSTGHWAGEQSIITSSRDGTNAPNQTFLLHRSIGTMKVHLNTLFMCTRAWSTKVLEQPRYHKHSRYCTVD
jgi:hypothetical protein